MMRKISELPRKKAERRDRKRDVKEHDSQNALPKAC